MRSFRYPAILLPEPNGKVTVQFPDLPEAITFGDDRQDALRQAADCLDEAVAARIADALPIPAPSAPQSDQPLVVLPGATAAKASLYLAMRDAGLSLSALAERMRLAEADIQRLLDPRQPADLQRLEQALASLGKSLVVSLENEAA